MMLDSRMISVFITVTMVHSVYGSYRSVGCYRHVFYNSYFISSSMEPKLCFLLCETPIIYIQNKICRCSGGGLMAHNREKCGNQETYSAYAEEKFYTEHAHLFNYKIEFTSCELWNTSGFYDTLQVKIDKSSVKSPLNQLEQCAATCLDRNATTKSIAFNGDNNQCLCIMPQNLNRVSNNTFYLTILPNNSCDRYCDNRLSDSNVKNKFKCGSSIDSRIWAIYNLNITCPLRSFYIQELKECIFPSNDLWDSCESPLMQYVYDGNVNWNIFLQAIEKLNLTNSNVFINFDVDVTIDPSWKCSTIETDYREDSDEHDSTSYSREIPSNYVLNSGCLRPRPRLYINSYSSYQYRIGTYLCIPNRVKQRSSSYDTGYYRSYGETFYSTWDKCPPGWLDINKNCYQISKDRKTIQEAKNLCINFSESETTYEKGSFMSPYRSGDDDDIDDDNDEMVDTSKRIMSDFLKGEIVQYASQWEVRLGFFLLDKSKVFKRNRID